LTALDHFIIFSDSLPVINSYAAALRVTFMSVALWVAVLFILQCRVKMPRLAR
jgi:hypothetical protein